jgi:2-phosphosulfolactate phosphatase
MHIQRATLQTCHQFTGAVVVIDVLRAFTTAAYAFAAGANDILLVSTVEEALALRQQFPGSLAMGEVGGLPPLGFDLGNSPAALLNADLHGRRLIQRTGAGTQGIVRSVRAEALLAASFVCAAATVRLLRQLHPPTVTFVITGANEQHTGDEDAACADYLAACLRGIPPPIEPFLERVRAASPGQIIVPENRPDLQALDLQCATYLDRFDFVMQVERQAGLLVMRQLGSTGL